MFTSQQNYIIGNKMWKVQIHCFIVIHGHYVLNETLLFNEISKLLSNENNVTVRLLINSINE